MAARRSPRREVQETEPRIRPTRMGSSAEVRGECVVTAVHTAFFTTLH